MHRAERRRLACDSAGEIRGNKSPVPSPPKAPRRMQRSRSSMTHDKHRGKHTQEQHTPEAAVAFYCLWEFTRQQLMGFQSAFTEPLSSKFLLTIPHLDATTYCLQLLAFICRFESVTFIKACIFLH